MRARRDGTFALAAGRPQVPGCDEAEAGGAVGGHGGLVQRDDLVAEVQRAVQAGAQLLHHAHDAHARHLLDHGRRGVQLPEDDLAGVGGREKNGSEEKQEAGMLFNCEDSRVLCQKRQLHTWFDIFGTSQCHKTAPVTFLIYQHRILDSNHCLSSSPSVCFCP